MDESRYRSFMGHLVVGQPGTIEQLLLCWSIVRLRDIWPSTIGHVSSLVSIRSFIHSLISLYAYCYPL